MPSMLESWQQQRQRREVESVEPLIEQYPTARRPRSKYFQYAILVLSAIETVVLMALLFQKLFEVENNLRRTSTVHFEPNTTYMNTLHQYDQYWNTLLGENEGAQVFYQGPGLSNVTVGTGMFHQFHCLASIRSTIQQLQDGKKIGHGPDDDKSEHLGHWPHCFDYLRQVCSAYIG